MSYYRNQLENWLKRISVHSESVIDVGGGENPVKTRVADWDVKEYRILDNDSKFNADYFYDLNSPLFYANSNISSLKEKNDVVFCLEVLEYIYDPITAIKNLYDLLKEEGIAYISFPTNYPLHNPPKIDYLRYSKNVIEKYLTLAGFKTWEITPRIATEGATNLRNFWISEGMHPMKGTDEIYDIGYLVKAYK